MNSWQIFGCHQQMRHSCESATLLLLKKHTETWAVQKWTPRRNLLFITLCEFSTTANGTQNNNSFDSVYAQGDNTYHISRNAMIFERIFSTGSIGKLLHLPLEDFCQVCSMIWKTEISLLYAKTVCREAWKTSFYIVKSPMAEEGCKCCASKYSQVHPFKSVYRKAYTQSKN